MMEALAIGLAVYGVGITFCALDWCRRADRERRATQHWFGKFIKVRDERDDLRAQVAKMDHDGDGKPGGSKPRGKG